MIEREADAALARMGLADAPSFTVPMPFNTLLWRVVAMTPEGFVEGERSLIADRGPMAFRTYASDVAAIKEAQDFPSAARLLRFNHHFAKAEIRDGQLVLSDLRMGAEPDYSFRFVVAALDGDGWRAIPARQLQWPWQAQRRLGTMWRRIWHAPGIETSNNSEKMQDRRSEHPRDRADKVHGAMHRHGSHHVVALHLQSRQCDA